LAAATAPPLWHNRHLPIPGRARRTARSRARPRGRRWAAPPGWLGFPTMCTPMSQTWILVGPDSEPYASAQPGTLGGHRRIYGSLNCPAALRAIARGGYVTHHVFFLTEEHARAAGYRPLRRLPPGCLRKLEGVARRRIGHRAGSCGKTSPNWMSSSSTPCGMTTIAGISPSLTGRGRRWARAIVHMRARQRTCTKHRCIG